MSSELASVVLLLDTEHWRSVLGLLIVRNFDKLEQDIRRLRILTVSSLLATGYGNNYNETGTWGFPFYGGHHNITRVHIPVWIHLHTDSSDPRREELQLPDIPINWIGLGQITGSCVV